MAHVPTPLHLAPHYHHSADGNPAAAHSIPIQYSSPSTPLSALSSKPPFSPTFPTASANGAQHTPNTAASFNSAPGALILDGHRADGEGLGGGFGGAGAGAGVSLPSSSARTLPAGVPGGVDETGADEAAMAMMMMMPEPVCGGCGKVIDESSADSGVIHFATHLWHPDCFRCAKCGNPVTTDQDDILLLSDGHPICGSCNYCCQVCGLPIVEEAIMTGDESYHASCFTCRSCHKRIDELVFAKTNQGIYCMNCHNERVARSRRHAEARRQKQAKKERSKGSPSVTSTPPGSSHSASAHPPPPFGASQGDVAALSSPQVGSAAATPVTVSSKTFADRNQTASPALATTPSGTVPPTPPVTSPAFELQRFPGSAAASATPLTTLTHGQAGDRDRDRAHGGGARARSPSASAAPASIAPSASAPVARAGLGGVPINDGFLPPRPGSSAGTASQSPSSAGPGVPPRRPLNTLRSTSSNNAQGIRPNTVYDTQLGGGSQARSRAQSGGSASHLNPSAAAAGAGGGGLASLGGGSARSRLSVVLPSAVGVGVGLGLREEEEEDGGRAGTSASSSSGHGHGHDAMPRSPSRVQERETRDSFDDQEPPPSAAEVKRASRLSVALPSGIGIPSSPPSSSSADRTRTSTDGLHANGNGSGSGQRRKPQAQENLNLSHMSRSFSFYDPDFLNLIKAIGDPDSLAASDEGGIATTPTTPTLPQQAASSPTVGTGPPSAEDPATPTADDGRRSPPKTAPLPKSRSDGHGSLASASAGASTATPSSTGDAAAARARKRGSLQAVPTQRELERAGEEYRERQREKEWGTRRSEDSLRAGPGPGPPPHPLSPLGPGPGAGLLGKVDEGDEPTDRSSRSSSIGKTPASAPPSNSSHHFLSGDNREEEALTEETMTEVIILDEDGRPIRTSSSSSSSHSDSDSSRWMKEEARMKQISRKVRESVAQAKDGHVSMDTSFVETLLRDLEETKEKMKMLQRRYDRIRRASQQAAQGFSMAKEEYEAEVQARREAQTEMARLKMQLIDQASKLATMNSERKHQERLKHKSEEMKNSLGTMERDLAKLKAERDLTVAEVEELSSLQGAGGDHSPTSRGAAASSNKPLPAIIDSSGDIGRRLSVRLDKIKDKYRSEIDSLIVERDGLIAEIDELRQARDVFLEETAALNTRNEELNVLNAQLNRQIDAANQDVARQQILREQQQQMMQVHGGHHHHYNQQLQQQQQQQHHHHQQSGGSGKATFTFPGFGRSRHANGSPSLSSIPNVSAPTASSSSSTLVHDNMDAASETSHTFAKQQPSTSAVEGHSMAPLPPTPSQPPLAAASAPAVARKFQWKKPKMGQTARGVGAMPGSGAGGSGAPSGSPALPPKPGQLSSSTAAAAAAAAGSGGRGAGGSGGGGAGHHGPPELVVREHLFQPFNFIRPVRCLGCGKNMWGQQEVRCALCGSACHGKCLNSLATSCTQPYSRDEPPEPVGPSMFGRELSEQLEDEGRQVPMVVEKCIAAVEACGMDYEGIYRKSGGSSQLRVITQLFERGETFDLEDMDRFNDISAITSVLKNYFRELPTPLLTFDLHEAFIRASETKNDPALRDEQFRQLIPQLPADHYNTLRHLILHLNRVAQRHEENRMSARNLGVVFGPTLMRSSDPSKEFSHMGGKALTIEYFIEHPEFFP